MDGSAPSLEEALGSALLGEKFPSMAVVQQRYLEFEDSYAGLWPSACWQS